MGMQPPLGDALGARRQLAPLKMTEAQAPFEQPLTPRSMDCDISAADKSCQLLRLCAVQFIALPIHSCGADAAA